MPILEHVHTYVKLKSRKNWWKCDDPGCTKIEQKDLVQGKLTCCNRCGTQMIMDRDMMRRSKPICLNCSDSKKGRDFRRAKDLMSKLLSPEEKDNPFNEENKIE